MTTAYAGCLQLSPGCTRWRLSEIETWEAAKAAGDAAR